MSLIHEALKKAAAEGGASEGQTPVSVRHSARSFYPVSSSVALFWGFFTLVLVSFLLSAPYLKRAAAPLSSSPVNRPAPAVQNPARQPSLIKPNAPLDRQKEGDQALALGLDLYRQGKVVPAYEAFSKAVSILPHSPVAHNNVGLILRQQGKIEEAIAHYREAIRIDPRYAEAQNNLGLIYDQIGSVDEAAAYYKKALSLKSNVAAFHFNYATLLERKGDFLHAQEEYQLYLRLESDPQKETAVTLVKGRLKELKGL